MVPFLFKNVCLESFAINLPEEEVSSAAIEDQIASVYKRLSIPFGTLERLSGVKSRRMWPRFLPPSEAATGAAEKAISDSSIDRAHIGALVNCSVTRDYFEPATSVLVHRKLGLSEEAIAFDITNACIGFSNGITVIGQMIESGAIKAGLVVTGENVRIIVDHNTQHILTNEKLTREELIKLAPTFTLGCGAAAWLLTHSSLSQSKHRILGAVARSATQGSELCVGNADVVVCQNVGELPLMRTESNELILSAAKLGGRMWKDASEIFGWSVNDVTHVFCHQVGKQVNEAFYAEVGLPIQKEFTIYRTLGNMVSAALPVNFAIGSKERGFKKGDKIVTLGYGSGLNAIFTCIEW